MAPTHANQELYSEVLAKHGPGLARVVAAYAHGAADREDLRQEFALALWKALPTHRGDSSLKTFAYRIATNLGISYLRSRRILLGERETEHKGPNPAAALEKADERARLRAAVDDLPLRLRQVVLLRLEGLRHAEIADVLGLTETNVSVRLSRAHKRLRAILQEDAVA